MKIPQLSQKHTIILVVAVLLATVVVFSGPLGIVDDVTSIDFKTLIFENINALIAIAVALVLIIVVGIVKVGPWKAVIMVAGLAIPVILYLKLEAII